MPQIPKAKQRISSAEKKQFIRPKPQDRTPEVKPDLTGAKIAETQAKTAFALADVAAGLAERQHKFDADKLTTQAATVTSRLQDEMVGFMADAKTKTGNDAIGIDEYNEQFNKFKSEIIKENKLEGTRVGDVIDIKMEKLNSRFKEELARHQEAEQVNAALNSIDSVIETNKVQAALFPDSMDEIISENNSNIDSVSEIVGSDKAEESKKLAETSIKSSAIMEIARTDMPKAEELLSTHRKTMPKEAVDVIEKEMSRIQKQTEADLEKAQKQAAEDWRAEDNKRQSAGNPMTVPEILTAPITEKEKSTRIKAAENRPTAFEETDQAVYADLSERIALNPERVNQNEIWDLVGKGKKGGLSTKDARFLDGKRSTAIDDAEKTESQRSPQQKTAYTALRSAKTAKLFDPENPAINITEHAKQVRALDSFIENNPDEDPVAYIDTILNPLKEEQANAIVRFFTGEPPAPPVIESPTERRIATGILTEQGVDIEDVTEERITETVEVRNLAIEALEAEGFPVNPENISAAMKQISKSLETAIPEGDTGVGF
jgi:hypothetical protein